MPLDPLQAILNTLPPVAPGHLRLYRVQSTAVAAITPWIQEAQQADGTAQARGRWFTRDPEALAFYFDDTAQPELVTLDLPRAEALACALDQLPDRLPDGSRPRAFSRDRETEHFVSPEQLLAQRLWPMAAKEEPQHRRGLGRGGPG